MPLTRKYLVTGGAGFIGSAVVRRLIEATDHAVLVVDKLTYAGNLDSLRSVSSSNRYAFEQADIVDAGTMRRIVSEFAPDVIMHLAAESHVDRSIDGPGSSSRPTSSLPLRCCRRRSIVVRSRMIARTAFVSITSRPMRCSARWAPRLFREDTPYSPELTLFGNEGCLRPSHARLASPMACLW